MSSRRRNLRKERKLAVIDLIIVLVIAVILYFGIRYWIRESKKGRCAGCSGCGGNHGGMCCTGGAGCSCHAGDTGKRK